jgi:hypothetical protein
VSDFFFPIFNGSSTLVRVQADVFVLCEIQFEVQNIGEADVKVIGTGTGSHEL